jgi:hypothetical protein
MLKKIFLALAFSLIASSAFAVCGAIPLTIKDASNVTQSLSSATAADGNCKTYIDADTASTLINTINSPLDNSSVAINVSTATTTQLVALSGSTVIYVTSYDVIAGGTGNITFVYGTGASCGTGTTSLTGAYPLTAQAGIAKGSGIGTILKVPAGNALCITTSAAVQMSGSVSYRQF